MLGICPLKVPLDIARQRHDRLLNLDRDAIGGQPDLPFQDIDGACGDLVIGALGVRRQAHLDLFGDRLDPFDTPRGMLRCCLFGITRHKAGERDDPFVRNDTDMRRIDARLEFEFIENILAKLQIADHVSSIYQCAGRLVRGSLRYLDPDQMP